MMNDNDRNKFVMVESNEAVVLSASTKLRIPMMRVSCKSADCEDLRIKIVESNVVSGILHEHHPQVDSPTNPWAKLHSKLHDPEIGVLRNCIPLTGKKYA